MEVTVTHRDYGVTCTLEVSCDTTVASLKAAALDALHTTTTDPTADPTARHGREAWRQADLYLRDAAEPVGEDSDCISGTAIANGDTLYITTSRRDVADLPTPAAVDETCTFDAPGFQPIESVAISPCGSLCAVADSDGRALLYDTTQPGCPRSLNMPKCPDSSTRIAFSPCGTWVAVTAGGGRNSGRYRVFSVSGATHTRTFTGCPCPVLSVAWSPCGSFLAVGYTGEVHIRDVQHCRKEPDIVLTGYEGDVVGLCLSSTAVVAVEEGSSDICVRPLGGDVSQRLVGHRGAVVSIAVSRDGRTLVSASKEGNIRVWCMEEMKWVAALDAPGVRHLSLSLGGTHLAASLGTSTVRLWNMHTWETLGDIDIASERWLGVLPWATLSPCGRWIFVANTFGVVVRSVIEAQVGLRVKRRPYYCVVQ